MSFFKKTKTLFLKYMKKKKDKFFNQNPSQIAYKLTCMITIICWVGNEFPDYIHEYTSVSCGFYRSAVAGKVCGNVA